MKNLFTITFLIAVFLLSPLFASAQFIQNPPPAPSSNPSTGSIIGCDGISVDSVKGLFERATCYISGPLVYLAFAVATLLFFIGVVRFFLFPDNEKSRTQSKGMIVWGLFALVMMVIFWGLVQIVASSLGLVSPS